MKKCIAMIGVICLWVWTSPGQAQFGFSGKGTPLMAEANESLSPAACGNRNPVSSDLSDPLSLYVGWLEHSKGNTWTLHHPQSNGIAPWPIRGIWLGASTHFVVNNPIGVLVAGYVLFPERTAANWYTEPAARSFDFEIPSYDWWAVEGFLTGNLCDNLRILGGFRWNHTSIRIHFSDSTDDDYVLNTYTPLAGVEYRQQFSTQRILVRIVGSPVIAGSLKYHFWDNLGFSEFGSFPVRNGSFVECTADYSVKMAKRLALGCFVKWNALRVKTAEQALSGSSLDQASWTVDTRAWIVGASASLAFESPF
jgi:hypothetical protein